METSHQEKEALKEVYGEDWRKGMKEKPEIVPRERCRSHVAEQARHRQKMKSKQRMYDHMKDGYKEQLDKGNIKPKDMVEYENILNHKKSIIN